MKSFIKLVIGLLTIISLIIFMLASTVTFFLLNPKYYISAFNTPGVYTNIQNGLKTSARDSLRAQLANEQINYDELTIGQRQQIDTQIETLLTPINEENIRDFSEKNITNILNYINAKSDRLVIYLPLTSWGLTDESLQQFPDYFKTTNIDLIKIKEDHPEVNINTEQITNLYNLGGKIKSIWLISLALTIVLLLIHLVLGDRKFRFVRTGRLLTGGGIIILFLAWVIRIFQNTFGQNIAARSEANDILIGTIASALLTNVFKLWIAASLIIILIGLTMFNIKPKKS
jgi:hypothetical protein